MLNPSLSLGLAKKKKKFRFKVKLCSKRKTHDERQLEMTPHTHELTKRKYL